MIYEWNDWNLEHIAKHGVTATGYGDNGMPRKNTKRKPWNQMTTGELAAATKQFEKPIRFEDTKPMTPAQQARWEKSRSGSVYSVRVYNGKKKTIRIQVDESLLKRFDEFAERNDMTRDEFIARSLRSAIAFAD